MLHTILKLLCTLAPSWVSKITAGAYSKNRACCVGEQRLNIRRSRVLFSWQGGVGDHGPMITAYCRCDHFNSVIDGVTHKYLIQNICSLG